MNKKIIQVALLAGLVLLPLCAPSVASAVKVAPLTYNIQLTNGQKKKGYVDVTNNDSAQATFTFSVQAFKQVNAAGDLQFYDDAAIQAGITLDYTTFELAPRQTLHLAFMADSTKLPSGDSFAAIFAKVAPREGVPAASVRVGTILTIQNGTPAQHSAEITQLNVPFIQIGNAIKGNYSIKNTGDPKKSTGFLPQVQLAVDPFHKTMQHQASLVFTGIERPNNFVINTGRFGFYKVQAAFGDSKKEAWVFFATPVAMVVGIGIVAIATLGTVSFVRFRRTRKRGARHTPSRG